MNEDENKVIMTKQVTWNGKPCMETVTQRDYDRMAHHATIVKLNGWSYKNYFDGCAYHIRLHFQDFAKKVFDETNPQLEVGMAATLELWSDRYAMTITRIISPKEIAVRRNETKTIDFFNSQYEILDELMEGEEIFTLRKGGTWVEKGQPKKSGSVTLTVGYRHHYVDPNF